ncbi:ULP_PROTEASE domain-containing protein [Durusdinium trenchii]|uniref:ULP_PROTEASE domain-containing protein n=1 Tax=Durusdinium trenchii TaxID=1381693 RepID=A0ABP0INE5_9DINO
MTMRLMMLSFVAILLLRHAEAAANCAKMAGCRNLAGGDQTRPVLDGEQYFTQPDGACSFGHVAENGLQCKPGPSCGYTLFNCICISEEAARDNSTGARNSRFLFGGGASVLAMTFVFCAWIWRRRPHRKIVPSIGLGWPQSIGQPQSRFTGVCVEQGPVIAEEVPNAKIAKWDCLSIAFIVFLPGTLVVAGIAIFISGLSIHVGEYYNGCRI